MGVFLRWGVFGILAVAGLMYAYNASKQMAQRRVTAPAPAAQTPSPTATPEPVAATTTPAPDEADALSATCALELDIARRAREARSVGEPLDRVLRIQEIAWQDDARIRGRLSQVATHWYSQTGSIDAALLRQRVVEDCEKPRS